MVLLHLTFLTSQWSFVQHCIQFFSCRPITGLHTFLTITFKFLFQPFLVFSIQMRQQKTDPNKCMTMHKDKSFMCLRTGYKTFSTYQYIKNKTFFLINIGRKIVAVSTLCIWTPLKLIRLSICLNIYLLGVSGCGFPAWVRVDGVKLEVGTMQSHTYLPPPGINPCEYSIIMTANAKVPMEQLLMAAAAQEYPYLAMSLQPLPPPLSPLSRIQQHPPNSHPTPAPPSSPTRTTTHKRHTL